MPTKQELQAELDRTKRSVSVFDIFTHATNAAVTAARTMDNSMSRVETNVSKAWDIADLITDAGLDMGNALNAKTRANLNSAIKAGKL